MTRKRKIIWIVSGIIIVLAVTTVILISIFTMEYAGGESFDDPMQINAEHQGKRVLLHMKSGLFPDDSQPCVAFNMAQGFLSSGYDLTILIDARANATFLGSSPEKTKWGKYKFPQAMIDALSAQLDIPIEEFPATYIGMMEWFSDQGASIYMNGTMNIANFKTDKIMDERLVPPYIQVVTYPEMAKLLAEADMYIAY